MWDLRLLAKGGAGTRPGEQLSATATLILSGSNVGGTLLMGDGSGGMVSGSLEGGILSFTLSQTTPCPGQFHGEAVLHGDGLELIGSIEGESCDGAFEAYFTARKRGQQDFAAPAPVAEPRTAEPTPLVRPDVAPPPQPPAPARPATSTSVPSARSSANDALRRGHELLEQKAYREAVDAFQQAGWDAGGPCAECLLGSAAAYSELGQLSDAEEAAREALLQADGDPLRATAHTLLGFLRFNRSAAPAPWPSATVASTARKSFLENMERARDDFRRAYELDGGRNSTIRTNLASTLDWLEEWPQLGALVGPRGSTAPEPEFVTDDIQPPRKIEGERPVRPAQVRATQIEGSVLLGLVIDESGTVTQIEVLEGLRGCTVAAIQAVTTWKYEPASRGGENIAVYHSETISFARSGG